MIVWDSHPYPIPIIPMWSQWGPSQNIVHDCNNILIGINHRCPQSHQQPRKPYKNLWKPMKTHEIPTKNPWTIHSTPHFAIFLLLKSYFKIPCIFHLFISPTVDPKHPGWPRWRRRGSSGSPGPRPPQPWPGCRARSPTRRRSGAPAGRSHRGRPGCPEMLTVNGIL